VAVLTDSTVAPGAIFLDSTPTSFKKWANRKA